MKLNKKKFIIFFLSCQVLFGHNTWDIIQEAILTPKCTMCHFSGSSFAEQSGLILTEDVAYDELINVTPQNVHAANDGLELVGTNGISSLYSSFLWEKINAPNYEHFYEDHPEYGSIMPIGLDFLTNGELEFIRQWIISGAPETGEVADESLLSDTTVFSPPEFEQLEIPENGLQVHIPPFNVPPQFERELFYYVELDTQDYVYVNRVTTTMRPGSHHFVLYTYDETGVNNLPQPNIYRDIYNFDGTTNNEVLYQMQFQKFISGSQTRLYDYTFPEGVALKVDPSFGFDLNSHYANYTNDTIIGEVYNNFYFSDPDEVERVAEILDLVNLDIDLPPNQETIISKTFWIDDEYGIPINIFQLWSHAHKLNTQFKIFRVKEDNPNFRELIYISYDWEHPPVMKYDPPMAFNINEGLELEATYFNNTNETVSFGLLSTDEMMVVFGLFYTGDQLNNDDEIYISSAFLLHGNYPNPFNPLTNIEYDLVKDEFVRVKVYDILGNIVNNLVNTNQSSGYKSIQWDATNNQGHHVSAGVYLYSIEAGDFRQTKKMILLK
ncbi:MAG: FlgD immunoglobulin-like domain containing protein [Candidatus Neomarinimicrobiota bacterium]